MVTIYTFPYVYIMIANTLGADRLRSRGRGGHPRRAAASPSRSRSPCRWWRPAIVSGFILAVLQALALFGSPAILALPAGFHTITTQIWSFFQYPPKVETGRRRRRCRCCSPPRCCCSCRSACSGGAATRPSAARAASGARSRSASWRYPALAAASPSWRARSSCRTASSPRRRSSRAWAQPLTWDNVTLANFSFTLFEYSATKAAIVNTLELGVITATRGRRAGRAARLRDQPAPRARPPVRRLPRARADRDPGRGARGGAVHRLHAAAVRAVRHARHPVRRLPDQGDARRLRAVRRDVPGHPGGAGGSGADPRCRPAAHPARRHGAAGAQRHHRGVVLHLHRRHPRAVGIHHPVHARTPR